MSFFENITEKAKQYANIAADKATALAEAAADKIGRASCRERV